MKYIYTITSVLFLLSCKAQQIIQPRYDFDSFGKDGVYYKDMDNDFNRFIGTWKYTSSNTSLTIKFQKKLNMHVQNTFSNYYTDALIGEYQYVENGIEKLNTLTNLNTDHQNPFHYSINGGTISKYGDPFCHDCDNPNQIKIRCSYFESDCEIYGDESYVTLRYFTDNGVEKIQFSFVGGGWVSTGLNGEPSPCEAYTLPYGVYIMTKQ